MKIHFVKNEIAMSYVNFNFVYHVTEVRMKSLIYIHINILCKGSRYNIFFKLNWITSIFILVVLSSALNRKKGWVYTNNSMNAYDNSTLATSENSNKILNILPLSRAPVCVYLALFYRLIKQVGYACSIHRAIVPYRQTFIIK